MEGDVGYSVLGIDDPRQQPITNNQYPIPTTSINKNVVDYLSHPSQTFRVHSVHMQVFNIISEQGDLVALVHPSIGKGPFHVVLARPVSFAVLEVGEPAHWRGNSIQFEHFSIDLSQASVWDPALPLVEEPIIHDAWHCLQEHVRQTDLSNAPNLTNLDAAVAERTQQAASLLLAGLHNALISDIVRGAELLAGLGVGLTPAGDDFLLGFMARIWLESALLPPGWTAPDLCQRIAQTAGPRTTRLSRTWLGYAARGQFAEPWHELATALTAGDPNAIHHAAARILSTGATSGRDAMAGVLIVNRE